MCLRRFFTLFVTVLTCFCLSGVCFAVPSESSSDDGSSSAADSQSPVIVASPSATVDDPLPVQIVEPDTVYSTPAVTSAGDIEVVIGDEPPSNPPFYGACWVTGTDSSLGTVTLYFPNSYKSGYWGLDSSGYLFNVSASSMSGYLAGVYNNSVSALGFSYPRYRVSSGSYYDYVDIHLTPTSSNMEIATSNASRYDFSDLFPYLLVVMMGGVFLCCMKRS